jgi:DNA-binding winged helix-turn-helix (wHTH) protein
MAGKNVYLHLIDKPVLDFRIAYLEKITNKKIDKKTLTEVLEQTGGHGSLTRHCLEALLATSNEQLATSAELVEFFLKQKPIRSVLFGIWNSLNPNEQDVLSLLNFSESETTHLEDVGLIKAGVLTIPLLREYVKDSTRIRSQNTGSIIFDQSTNEIKKGELLISDKLTSSEFKLLQYFILNPEKVLNREEVINSVWKSMQSTAGVTDQALDQLIFRLRKKIENDPNKPTHIETIKGRGFKFTP